MKVAAFLCVTLVLAGGAKADFLGDLINNILKPTGQQIVDQLKPIITDAANNALQQILGSLGKRSIPVSKEHLDKIKEVMANHIQSFKDKMAGLFDKLKELAEKVKDKSWVSAGLTKREVHALIDAEHARHVRDTRGILNSIIGSVVGTAVGAITDKISEVTGINIPSSLVSGAINTAINSGALDKILGAFGKREIATRSLIDTLKEHVSGVWDKVTGDVNDAKDKIKEHTDKIMETVNQLIAHGTTSAQELKEAVEKIVAETFQVAGPEAAGIAKETVEAINDIKETIGKLFGQ